MKDRNPVVWLAACILGLSLAGVSPLPGHGQDGSDPGAGTVAPAATPELDALTAAIAADPDDPGPRLARAELYRKQQLPARALEDLDAVLAADPAHVPARIARAALFDAQNAPLKALADLDAALAAVPGDAAALAARARLNARIGQPAAALADFDRALVVSPDDPALAAARDALAAELAERRAASITFAPEAVMSADFQVVEGAEDAPHTLHFVHAATAIAEDYAGLDRAALARAVAAGAVRVVHLFTFTGSDSSIWGNLALICAGPEGFDETHAALAATAGQAALAAVDGGDFAGFDALLSRAYANAGLPAGLVEGCARDRPLAVRYLADWNASHEAVDWLGGNLLDHWPVLVFDGTVLAPGALSARLAAIAPADAVAAKAPTPDAEETTDSATGEDPAGSDPGPAAAEPAPPPSVPGSDAETEAASAGAAPETPAAEVASAVATGVPDAAGAASDDGPTASAAATPEAGAAGPQGQAGDRQESGDPAARAPGPAPVAPGTSATGPDSEGGTGRAAPGTEPGTEPGSEPGSDLRPVLRPAPRPMIGDETGNEAGNETGNETGNEAGSGRAPPPAPRPTQPSASSPASSSASSSASSPASSPATTAGTDVTLVDGADSPDDPGRAGLNPPPATLFPTRPAPAQGLRLPVELRGAYAPTLADCLAYLDAIENPAWGGAVLPEIAPHGGADPGTILVTSRRVYLFDAADTECVIAAAGPDGTTGGGAEYTCASPGAPDPARGLRLTRAEPDGGAPRITLAFGAGAPVALRQCRALGQLGAAVAPLWRQTAADCAVSLPAEDGSVRFAPAADGTLSLRLVPADDATTGTDRRLHAAIDGTALAAAGGTWDGEGWTLSLGDFTAAAELLGWGMFLDLRTEGGGYATRLPLFGSSAAMKRLTDCAPQG